MIRLGDQHTFLENRAERRRAVLLMNRHDPSRGQNRPRNRSLAFHQFVPRAAAKSSAVIRNSRR